jgi:hypothetical protein
MLRLRNYVAHFGSEATPIFIAPYLSPEAQGLCRENQVGFLDLEGNARLVFDSVFIERLVSSKPSFERRELKSLFKPKSAQVLRVMLRDPARPWRVTELAELAGVSLGHVRMCALVCWTGNGARCPTRVCSFPNLQRCSMPGVMHTSRPPANA